MSATTGQIPAYGKGALPPNMHEAEGFLDEVDDVSRLIAGLHSGKVSAEYVDRRIREKEEEEQREVVRVKAKVEDAEKKKYENLPEEKKKEVKVKVEEMIREKERREKARFKFAQYREKLPAEDARRAQSTDYSAWDLWTPSDDEADPWMGYMPNNPAFKAMEADIDKRHARQVAQRQTAYRKREEGNAAFKAGQYAEALKIYEAGLEADKRSIELHGNAAMAALKSGCFVQAITHCDKANEIAACLFEQPAHPTAVKCLQRRATARLALRHFKDAVADLTIAHERHPGSAEIVKQLAGAKAEYEEARKEKEVERGFRKAGEGKSGNVEGTDYAVLLEVEGILKRIGAPLGTGEVDGPATPTSADYERLEKLLEESEQCRVFIRAGGGVGLSKLQGELSRATAAITAAAAAASHSPTDACSASTSQSEAAVGLAMGPVYALRAACFSEPNRDALAKSGGLETCIAFMAATWRAATGSGGSGGVPAGPAASAAAAAAFLLHTCSASDAPRRRIAAALAADVSTTGALAAVLGMLSSPVVSFSTSASAPASASASAPSSSSSSSARALWSSSTHARITAAHALSLLGNCALEAKTKAALRAFGESDGGGGEGGGGIATVPGLVAPLLRSGNSMLAARAAALLGNLCGDPALRAQLAADTRAVGDLVRLLPARKVGTGLLPASGPESVEVEAVEAAGPAGLGGGLASRQVTKKKKNATGAGAGSEALEGDNVDLTLSVLAALTNVLVEEPARVAAADTDAVARLLRLLGESGPAAIPARAASALSRLARMPTVASALLADGGHGGAAAVAQFVASHVETLPPALPAAPAAGIKAEAVAAVEEGAAGAWDAGVRTLAVLIASSDTGARTMLAGCAAATLVSSVAAAGATDRIVGNAALAIADLGKEASLLPLLALLQPIAPLLKACHERTGAAQKNAAIACARLAHHPPMLATLKENNGLELIYRYVKP